MKLDPDSSFFESQESVSNQSKENDNNNDDNSDSDIANDAEVDINNLLDKRPGNVYGYQRRPPSASLSSPVTKKTITTQTV